MKDMAKYEEMIKRAEYTAGDRIVELIRVAQQLTPDIEKGIRKQVKAFEARKSDSVAYRIDMKDLQKKMNDLAGDLAGAKSENILRFTENISIESLFLILSAVAWHNPSRIVTEINFTRDQSLGIWFRFGNEGNEEPSVESCTEQ